MLFDVVQTDGPERVSLPVDAARALGRFMYADGNEATEEWGPEFPECGDPIERAHPVTGEVASLQRVELNYDHRFMRFREVK